MSGGVKSCVVLGLVVALLATTGAAGAQTSGELDEKASRAEAKLQRQEATLDQEIGDLAKVGARLEEAREGTGEVASRMADLEQETRGLSRSLKAQRDDAAESRARFKARLSATYKGQQFDGVVLLLQGLFGGDVGGDALSAVAARMLAEDRESMRLYKKDRQVLSDAIRQLDGRQAEYAESREEHRARAEELERREAELEGAIRELREEKGRTEAGLEDIGERIEELEARERAERLDPPASGGGDLSREEEDRIAREEIVVDPVEELPLSRYRRLYREAAEDYGFGRDWYVLMAVGKVESNHGENMGPSSAGALGPMQFLPSTWEFAGVDGDGDGAANVMDPEDAIPAAAKYLADGGAPEDWYAALYTYNHADWYVREVLEVAEQYRLLAGDDSVGPYGVASSPAATSAPKNTEAPPPSEPAPEQPESEEPTPEQTVPEEPAEDEEPPELTTSPQEATSPSQQY